MAYQQFDVQRVAEFLSLFANANRLLIFCCLTEREWDVASLAANVGLSQSALSQHLKKMRDGRLVKARREGQVIYYRCDTPSAMKFLATLERMFGQAEEATARVSV